MSCEWPESRLEELTEEGSSITYGVVKPGPHESDGVLFVRGGDILNGTILRDQLRTIGPEVSKQYRRTLLRGGEMLVSLVGNPGQVALVPTSLAGANIARQVGLVRLGEGVDARYVMYFLQSPSGQAAIGARSMGSVQQVINLRDLKKVWIPLPSLPEQHAIASILGALDDKIELNRKMSQTLEATAQAIYQDRIGWFQDASDRMLANWRIGPVSGIAAEKRDKIDPRKSDGEWFAHFSLPAYDSGMRPAVEIGASIKSAKTLVHPGAVLVSKLNPRFPRVWMPVTDHQHRAIASTEFLVLVPKPPATRSFLYCTVKAHRFMSRLASYATGTSGSHQRVRPESVMAAPVVMPPYSSVQEFGALVDPILARATACIMEEQTLSELRDVLLPRLLDGSLAVLND